jgi:hypothetical protein
MINFLINILTLFLNIKNGKNNHDVAKEYGFSKTRI